MPVLKMCQPGKPAPHGQFLTATHRTYMKLTSQQIEQQKTQRQLGIAVNQEDEDNRDSWQILAGLDRILTHASQVGDKGLLADVATARAKLPDFSTAALDPASCAVENPNVIKDPKLRALKKHRAALKELVEAGIGVAIPLYEMAPMIDPKKRLRAPQAAIAESLGAPGCNLPASPGFVKRIADACRTIGQRDFTRLPEEYKEAVFTGARVHPRALKVAHLSGKPAA